MLMNVFVIGGTGLVGSYLLPRLIKERHEVYALTRNESKLQKIKEVGAHGILGDIRIPQSFKDNLPEKLDIIVLLAMPEVKPGKRISQRRKAVLKEDTNAFFRNTKELAIYYDIPVILPGGTSYSTQEGEIADETWPILREGLTEIGADIDKMVRERSDARKSKDWERADEIRKQLEQMNIILEDGPDGTVWKIKS